MQCQLMFARDERQGVLVLDCILTDVADVPTAVNGVPFAVEVATPGRTLGDQLALASVRRWVATGVITGVVLHQPDGVGRLRAEVRSAGGATAVLEPTRVVGLQPRVT